MADEEDKVTAFLKSSQSAFSSSIISPQSIELEPSLTYECLSATVPFEKMYQSEDRINFTYQDLSTFPQDYVVIEKFPKLDTEKAVTEVSKLYLSKKKFTIIFIIYISSLFTELHLLFIIIG